MSKSEENTPNVSPGAPRGGLRRALYGAVIVSLVLPGVIAGLSLIYLNLQHTIESETRVRAESLADLLQAGMINPMWDMAPETGRPLIDAIATDPSVRVVEVRDVHGVVQIEFRRQSPDSTPPIVVNRPVAHQGEALGEARIAYSTEAAVGDARRASLRLLSIVALQLLVSFFLIGAWLSRRVLRPLETLRLSARRIADGDLQSGVSFPQSDEFGQLAESLDVMRDSLAQSVTRLEERVEERTQALKAVNARLQKTLDDLQRMQNRLVQSEKLASLGSLVAGVAHELNTPIGTGVTVVSTIADRCVELRRLIEQGIRRSQLDATLDDIGKAADLAQASLQRAARLVQDFKQVAVDQTSSRRRTFDLHELLREMMVAVRLRHKRAPVAFEIDVPPGIPMDSYPGTLEQVLTNLIDNSVIHGAEGRSGCVVTITAKPHEAGVVLTVADNGRGIPAASLPRVFDPFFTTRLGQGGSGLGLSIVYGLVTGILGGHIEVQSEEGRGTRFTLELPTSAPQRDLS